MTENQTRLARVRKEQFGGDCAICNGYVELLCDKEPWIIKCLCGSVTIPNWANIDNYQRARFLSRFELKRIPAVTEG